MRAAHVGLLVGAVHFTLSLIGGIIALGAGFGAFRSWADSIGEQVVIALTFVLLPLSLANVLLPRDVAPGYPVFGVVLTSVLWGVAAYAIAHWRHVRSRLAGPPT